MKAMTIIAPLVAALVAVAGFQTGQQADASKTKPKMKVGTRPANVAHSIDITKVKLVNGNDVAMFAAGCFWGVEERFRQIPGVIATAVGYTGGRTKNPTYKQVCDDDTGHAEVVLLEFDPSKITYDELLDVFWKNHDPTTLNRQGPDFGDQYRSAVFFRNDAQRIAAADLKDKLNKTKFKGRIVTEITRASEFTMAEEYHQQYCEKNGIAACPIR